MSTNDPRASDAVIWPKLIPAANGAAITGQHQARKEERSTSIPTSAEFAVHDEWPADRPTAVKLSDMTQTALAVLVLVGGVLLVAASFAVNKAWGRTGPIYSSVEYVNVVTLAMGQLLLLAGVLTCLTAVLVGTLRTR